MKFLEWFTPVRVYLLLGVFGVAFVSAVYFYAAHTSKIKCENAALVAGLKDNNKAAKTREKIEDETRKLTDPVVDQQLFDGGWMRPADDR